MTVLYADISDCITVLYASSYLIGQRSLHSIVSNNSGNSDAIYFCVYNNNRVNRSVLKKKGPKYIYNVKKKRLGLGVLE